MVVVVSPTFEDVARPAELISVSREFQVSMTSYDDHPYRRSDRLEPKLNVNSRTRLTNMGRRT